jgi:DNA-binding transcriptional MerR regulator
MSVEEVKSFRDSGLLPSPRRTRGRSGDRAFHGEHVARLAFIRRALDLEFPREDIARLVDPGVLVVCIDVYRLVERHLQRLKQRADAQIRAIENLERLMDSCPRTGSRRDCPILAALSGSTG